MRMIGVFLCLALVLWIVPGVGCAQTTPQLRGPDVIYVPTPREVVDAML